MVVLPLQQASIDKLPRSRQRSTDDRPSSETSGPEKRLRLLEQCPVSSNTPASQYKFLEWLSTGDVVAVKEIGIGSTAAFK